MKASEIAKIVKGKLYGNPEYEIKFLCPLSHLKKGGLSFYEKENKDTLKNLEGCIITRFGFKKKGLVIIEVKNPKKAWAKIVPFFKKKKTLEEPKPSFIHPSAKIASDVTIYPFVYVGEDVEIGEKSIIYPHVTILEKVKIGKKVVIGPGSVIGFEGFGYIEEKEEYIHIPHIGGVIIEDNVEIGAGVTIDRGTVEDTVIGKGTKIDNLCHIAHNVKIGRNCIIAAQTGIAGSTIINNNVKIAGQSGVKEHLKIGKNVKILAKSAVYRNISDGEVYSGIPARPHFVTLRALAKLFKDIDKR